MARVKTTARKNVRGPASKPIKQEPVSWKAPRGGAAAKKPKAPAQAGPRQPRQARRAAGAARHHRRRPGVLALQ